MDLIVNEQPKEKGTTMLDGAHLPMVGKLAVLTDFGLILTEQYELVLGIGNLYADYAVHSGCHRAGKYRIKLMFIDEPTFIIQGQRFFCLKEVGPGIGKYGDWHWYTLDQLVFCKE